MHEVKLARQVFRRLLEIAAEHKLERVKKVVLRVNCLESENGEVLSAALKDLSAGTALADAQVEILCESVEETCAHDHDHDHHDSPGLGEVTIERIEA